MLESYFRPVCPACQVRSSKVFVGGCARYTCVPCGAQYCPVCMRGFHYAQHTHDRPCRDLYRALLKYQDQAANVGWRRVEQDHAADVANLHARITQVRQAAPPVRPQDLRTWHWTLSKKHRGERLQRRKRIAAARRTAAISSDDEEKAKPLAIRKPKRNPRVARAERQKMLSRERSRLMLQHTKDDPDDDSDVKCTGFNAAYGKRRQQKRRRW